MINISVGVDGGDEWVHAAALSLDAPKADTVKLSLKTANHTSQSSLSELCL